MKSEYLQSSMVYPSSQEDTGHRKSFNDTKRSTVHEIQNASQYENTRQEYVNSLEGTHRQKPIEFVNHEVRTTGSIIISPEIELNSKCTAIN